MLKIKTTKKIAYSGITASLYIVLTLATLPFSSGAVQVRIAEGLTILPLFFPESIIGLFVGCVLSNIICGLALYDIILGSAITLFASIFTYIVGRIIKNEKLRFFIGGLFPVLFNSFFLPLIWVIFGILEYVYLLQVLFIFIGESISVYGIGILVYKGIKKIEDKL